MGRGGHLTERLRQNFREGRTEGYDWKIEPDGSWELADRLVVFAMSENGDYLAGDSGSRGRYGELPIFHTTRFDSLTRIGDDLHHAVEWLRVDVNRQDSHPVDFVALIPSALGGAGPRSCGKNASNHSFSGEPPQLGLSLA